MKTNVLGYPRIGTYRELKKSCESYWIGKISYDELLQTGRNIRKANWQLMSKLGIDLIPSNDFSYYDQVLDMTLALGAIPQRYADLQIDLPHLYFAMARGMQSGNADVIAMEMTKWFDTNYHYIVPEFVADQQFKLFHHKALSEFNEAKKMGIITKPVLLGPVSYLLLGKEKKSKFDRLDLADRLLPVYQQLLDELAEAGAQWIQIDEPCLSVDLTEKAKCVYARVYSQLHSKAKLMLTTYFGGLRDNLSLVSQFRVDGLHIDLARCPEQLEAVLANFPVGKYLSVGVVDGRNVWKNDFDVSLSLIDKALQVVGSDHLMVSGSCSFLHVPCDLDAETDGKHLGNELKTWMAYAKQKVAELILIRRLADGKGTDADRNLLQINRTCHNNRKTSPLIHNQKVKDRMAAVSEQDKHRKSPFKHRIEEQHRFLDLPLFPTTTIGSFPQTVEVRAMRSRFRKGEISKAAYTDYLKKEIEKAVRWQESVGLDVLVHGEFERNDMVEYFGEKLNGFAFSQNGWVQSYGSRCVKPPVIFGDVSRPNSMTVDWTTYAQSLTSRPMKGMLTGPVTILQWSFVRNDQPRSLTCQQIALAIRDEVCDLEKAGIKVIQIDEPAIREGLPLRQADRAAYLTWAVQSFRLSTSGVRDSTQIHTHMCYSEFSDIIESIAAMDADVITIECSRSQMELLDTFAKFKYPNEIGPGVYDIHSPRVPSVSEMVNLLHKAAFVVDYRQLWVNPDCGLKTRAWTETQDSVKNMVQAAFVLRSEYGN